MPVAALKVAHVGFPEIEKLRVYPEGPVAVGVKPYATPATSLVAGVPEMTGAGIRHLVRAFAPVVNRSPVSARSRIWRMRGRV